MSQHNSEIDARVDVLGLWNLHGSSRCDVPLCRLDRHLDFLQDTASEKTYDVAWSSGWLVLGVGPQLGNRRTC